VYGVIVARDNTTAPVDGGMGNEIRAFQASRNSRTKSDVVIGKPALIMPTMNAPTLPCEAPLSADTPMMQQYLRVKAEQP